MGYTTDFRGSIKITPKLTENVKNFINGLQNSRRMKRNPSKLPKRVPKTNPLGTWGDEGEFYFNPKSENLGQENTKDIIDYNNPPATQPSLWLQWVIEDAPSEEDYFSDKLLIEEISKSLTLKENSFSLLTWNGAEKFYGYTEWLIYLIKKIFEPLGYKLNGKIIFLGEEEDGSDVGKIVVENNKVTKVFFE